MKVVKIILVAIIFLSALFQIIAGLWMLIDIESAGAVLLGLTGDNAILANFEFNIITKIAGKSFLMLSVYSLLTIYYILKERKAGFILGFAGGMMIMIIAVTTFIDTKSMFVWLTDFLRGSVIVCFTILFYRLKLKSTLEVGING